MLSLRNSTIVGLILTNFIGTGKVPIQFCRTVSNLKKTDTMGL
jgi:hypothetical protein